MIARALPALLLSMTSLVLASSPGCAPAATRGSTAGNAAAAEEVGARKLDQARQAPHHVGARPGPFRVWVPCSEARYVGFDAPPGRISVAIDAAAEGAKTIQLRTDLLDGNGQVLLQRREDIGATGTHVDVGAAYQDLDGGKGRIASGTFFVRFTAENPHCRGLSLTYRFIR